MTNNINVLEQGCLLRLSVKHKHISKIFVGKTELKDGYIGAKQF